MFLEVIGIAWDGCVFGYPLSKSFWKRLLQALIFVRGQKNENAPAVSRDFDRRSLCLLSRFREILTDLGDGSLDHAYNYSHLMTIYNPSSVIRAHVVEHISKSKPTRGA